MRFKNKKVLITGASRGIGYQTARAFLKEGAEVFGLGRDRERLQKSAAELSKFGTFHDLVCDLSDLDSLPAIPAEIEKHWSCIDILVNNAAVNPGPDILPDTTLEQFQQTLNINILAVSRLIQLLLPFLLQAEKPRVINVSSGAGTFDHLKRPGMSIYKVSKFALNGLTIAWASDLKDKVAVNAIDPGWVKTDMGGPDAPGDPAQSARDILDLAEAPFEKSGLFWADGQTHPKLY